LKVRIESDATLDSGEAEEEVAVLTTGSERTLRKARSQENVEALKQEEARSQETRKETQVETVALAKGPWCNGDELSPVSTVP
jgi:hypothetical protein